MFYPKIDHPQYSVLFQISQPCVFFAFRSHRNIYLVNGLRWLIGTVFDIVFIRSEIFSSFIQFGIMTLWHFVESMIFESYLNRFDYNSKERDFIM